MMPQAEVDRTKFAEYMVPPGIHGWIVKIRAISSSALHFVTARNFQNVSPSGRVLGTKVATSEVSSWMPTGLGRPTRYYRQVLIEIFPVEFPMLTVVELHPALLLEEIAEIRLVL